MLTLTGLLPLLRSIQKTRHVKEFKGQTLGVDAYVWLHRGIISCATELALGKPTKKYAPSRRVLDHSLTPKDMSSMQ